MALLLQVQPYFAHAALLPQLMSLHGRSEPHDARAALHAISLLHMVCDPATFERLASCLLEGLAHKCATSPMRVDHFPFSAAYPWLSLTCCLVGGGGGGGASGV